MTFDAAPELLWFGLQYASILLILGVVGRYETTSQKRNQLGNVPGALIRLSVHV
jgi:hypothetical protein